MTSYEVYQAQTFWDCVHAVRRDDTYFADLMQTLLELQLKPFGNPKLQTHDVGKALNGRPIYSSDVGGRASDRRLVWQLLNRTIVVLLYGTHAVQDRAKRMRIGFDEADKVVTIYEQALDNGAERTYQQQRAEVGKLLMAWTNRDLEGFGFAAPAIALLRSLDTDDELLAAEKRLSPEDFERAFNLIAHGHPDGATGQPEVEPAIEPAATDEDRELERQLDDARAGAWFTKTEPEFLLEVLSQPIEDWMIFLHPDQRAIVRRSFNGPARVRGSAGTGKTVVALHRAAWLAERNRVNGVREPILFTTFIKSLPPVFERLYLRLPGTVAGEVEFIHIDKLAAQTCIKAGARQVTAPREIEAAYATAHKRVVADGTPLALGGFTRQYLRDEITSVIRGRGIGSLDVYLEIERTGRRAQMNKDHRRQVWALLQEWNTEMAKRQTVDFCDVVLQARDHARQLGAPRYSAAIIDEAQDLTLTGLQLVRALVNAPDSTDKPDGLLFVGDGAQRIYAGGFTLRQAGIEVRGRTSVLKTNYRNTREIIGAAMAVTGDAPVEDLAEEFRRGDAEAETERHGGRPLLLRCGNFQAQCDEVVDRVRALVADGAASAGDVGVLVPTNKLAEAVVSSLKAAGFTAIELDKYDGTPVDRVKVGTYHRGKGLEFKVVFLPGLTKGQFPRAADAGQPPQEAEEARLLAISQLFVAMTRARDQLVVLCDGEPSEVFAAVEGNYFAPGAQ